MTSTEQRLAELERQVAALAAEVGDVGAEVSCHGVMLQVLAKIGEPGRHPAVSPGCRPRHLSVVGGA